MDFRNVYEEERRAEAYSRMGFPGTYYLAYRDLPGIISDHVVGWRALDFGCGTGRSTRFLGGLGFQVTGADISRAMVVRARELDPEGDYRILDGTDYSVLEGGYDLILAAFPFDNIPHGEKVSILSRLRGLLGDGGKLLVLVSSPEIYLHEWLSFSTRDFPENRSARSGDRVRIVQCDTDDERPVEDIVCTDEDYARFFEEAGLACLARYKPMGRQDEPYEWVNEDRMAPWAIHVLGKE